MKKYALALAAIFVLAIACGGGGGTPDQVVQKALDAVENADGDALLGCMSSEAVVEFEAAIEEMKATPEETAGMAAFLGIEITAEEVSNLTPGRAISLILSSEMVTAEMPDLSAVEIGEAVIDGDIATVSVTMDGETDEIELLLEDGNWKIGGDGMDFGM